MNLRVRAAAMDDAETLLAWRNDSGTMRYSFVKYLVRREDHEAWLRRALDDPKRRLCIVDDEWPGWGPVGTYRLDHVGSDLVEVSLTVAPEHRGRGYATPVILLATRHAVSLGAMTVIAHISVENAPSLRAFQRAGFALQEQAPLAGGVFSTWTIGYADVAAGLCGLCKRGVVHHTNSSYSIGGGDRRVVWDIHAVDDPGGVGLQECLAGDVLLAWERFRPSAGEHGAAGDPRTGIRHLMKHSPVEEHVRDTYASAPEDWESEAKR